MKGKILISILFLFILSCASSDDNSENEDCNLIQFKAAQLFYEYFDRQNVGLGIAFDENFDGIHVVYDNQNRISQIVGGPVVIAQGQNLTNWIMSNGAVYNVTYSGNTITITSNIQASDGDNINEYTVANSKVISREIILPQGLTNEKLAYTYQYNSDKIFEYREDELYRTFYFENNNLVKVEQLIYFNPDDIFEDSDMLYAKLETIFSDFDDLPNLLQGKFFIDGAFFKAFSQNNYHSIESKYYLYDQELETFEAQPFNTISRFFNFDVNEDGSSGLFLIECPN